MVKKVVDWHNTENMRHLAYRCTEKLRGRKTKMIQLHKMNDLDFEDYMARAIIDYAADKVATGVWVKAEAVQLAKKAFDRLLPNGANTENEYLFTILNTEINQKIGYLWFQLSETLLYKTAFILDFIIFEPYRGRGYGQQTLKTLEEVAKRLDIHKMILHVFAHNTTAIALYEKLGYKNTDITMGKYL